MVMNIRAKCVLGVYYLVMNLSGIPAVAVRRCICPGGRHALGCARRGHGRSHGHGTLPQGTRALQETLHRTKLRGR